jgi:hypothetical protein
MKKHENNRICFVIMKFGEKDTQEFQRQKSIYQNIIKPAVEESGLSYRCLRADEIIRPGSIIKDIVKTLWEADVVIADLTDQNPNVFYELGVRHAIRGRTIMITQSMADIPFDLRNYRVIQYSPNSPEGFRQVTQNIRKNLTQLSEDEKLVNSPVMDSLPKEAISQVQELEQPISLQDRAAMDMQAIRTTIDGLGIRFDDELLPKLDMLNKRTVRGDQISEWFEQFALRVQPALLTETYDAVKAIRKIVEGLEKSKDASRLMDEFGLIAIHRNRLDALEHTFYTVLEAEDRQIDIVGSTIFGLKGTSRVTPERVLDLLRAKMLMDKDFVIRILLTHCEVLSTRQDQERNVKAPDRYVISNESLDAIEQLRKRDLLDHVKFYRGAPTCFTIVCHAQKQMLLNPYPYEKEAYSSWAITLREIPSGVFQEWLLAHVENPWVDTLLTEPFTEKYREKLQKKYDDDIEDFITSQKKRPEKTRTP